MSKQGELRSILETTGVVIGSLVLGIVIIVTATSRSDKELPEPKLVVETQQQQNMRPVAEVKVATNKAETFSDSISGEKIVKANCALCHSTGLMGSPKIGDGAQWAPRIATGKDSLVHNAINGIRTMPAKGGNASLTDEEIEAAVVYMINSSGGQL